MNLPEDQDLIDTLILEGALVISGVNEEGEIVYNVTDRLKDLAPELYYKFLQIMKDSVMFLWEQGFVNMDITLENPLVTPTEKALNTEAVQDLPDNDKQTLEALMRAFKGEI